MKDKYAKYKGMTFQQIKEKLEKYIDDNPSRLTFNKPIGQIGNTGVYRLSDNCLTGIGGWNAFQKELMRQGGVSQKDIDAI